MIITCPECDTRFVVPSTIFMRGGRDLRCSSCKHRWFQEEPLEKAGGLNYAATLKNNDDTPPKSDDKKELLLDKIKDDFINGYKIIFGMCCLVILAFLGYRMMVTPLIIGEGLAFNNVSIDRQADQVVVTGEIVNAMDSDRGVPPIEITTILRNDIQGDTAIFTPEKEILHSGEIIVLKATLNDVGPEVKNIHVTFQSNEQAHDEKMKTKDDGNAHTDAHHAHDAHTDEGAHH